MDDTLVIQAQRMAEVEKNMPLKQAVRKFWKGGLWSMTLSLALVMEGYDLGLVHSTLRTILIPVTCVLRSTFFSVQIWISRRCRKSPYPCKLAGWNPQCH